MSNARTAAPLGPLPALIFSSRWLQLPLYLGLIAALALSAAGSLGTGCTTVTAEGVMGQTIIHSAFILSALGIAWTDRLMSHIPRAAATH